MAFRYAVLPIRRSAPLQSPAIVHQSSPERETRLCYRIVRLLYPTTPPIVEEVASSIPPIQGSNPQVAYIERLRSSPSSPYPPRLGSSPLWPPSVGRSGERDTAPSRQLPLPYLPPTRDRSLPSARSPLQGLRSLHDPPLQQGSPWGPSLLPSIPLGGLARALVFGIGRKATPDFGGYLLQILKGRNVVLGRYPGVLVVVFSLIEIRDFVSPQGFHRF